MKQPGEIARIYFDGRKRIEAGDFIQTPTGRTYLVQANRVQERGKNAGRQHLTTVVMAPGHPLDESDMVHQLAWYPRRKKARPTHREKGATR